MRETVTATNLAELAAGTHLLPDGSTVQVAAFYARASGAKVYVFNHPPTLAVVVQIVAAGGAGEYDGKILGGASTATAGGTLVMPEGLTVPSSPNALVLNLEENGLAHNRLLADSYAIGVIRGLTRETPPRRIVLIGGGVGGLKFADRDLPGR